jgi:hypothetical protein
LTIFCLSTIAISIHWGKPIDPILGETFQAKIGETLCYFEQTCVNPPTFNYYITNHLFTSYGYSQLESNASANSMKMEEKGKFFIKFKDGPLYNVKAPGFLLTGLMLGKRYFNLYDSFVIEDLVMIIYYY